VWCDRAEIAADHTEPVWKKMAQKAIAAKKNGNAISTFKRKGGGERRKRAKLKPEEPEKNNNM